MAGALLNRINKLRDHIQGPTDRMEIVVISYGDKVDEKIAEAHNQNPNANFMLIINPYGGDPDPAPVFDSIDLEIEREIERLKKYGLSENEIRAACKIAEPSQTNGKKADKNPGARTGTRRKKAG